MPTFLIGMLFGYIAKKELNQGFKAGVKGVARVISEVQNTYTAVKEDVTDAVAEERSSRSTAEAAQ